MVGSDHCLRCKRKTPNRGEGITKTKNGRMRRHSQCGGCGAGKSTFLPGGTGLSAGISQPEVGSGYGKQKKAKRGRKGKGVQDGEGIWDDIWGGVQTGVRGATDAVNTFKPLVKAVLA